MELGLASDAALEEPQAGSLTPLAAAQPFAESAHGGELFVGEETELESTATYPPEFEQVHVKGEDVPTSRRPSQRHRAKLLKKSQQEEKATAAQAAKESARAFWASLAQSGSPGTATAAPTGTADAAPPGMRKADAPTGTLAAAPTGTADAAPTGMRKADAPTGTVAAAATPTGPMAAAPSTPPGPFAMERDSDAPDFLGPATVCSQCKNPVDVLLPGTRTVAKSPPTFMCSTCNSKCVGLYRICGNWPTADFKDLTDEEQTAFWNSCDAKSKDLKESYVNALTKRNLQRREAGRKGKFLPLSVYERKGYNIEDIELNTAEEDKEKCPVVGWTYRLKVHETLDVNVEETERKKVLESLEPKAERKPRGGRRGTSRSRSRGDDKELAKERKDAERKREAERRDTERQMRKEEEKKKTAIKTMSARVVAKLSPCVLKLEHSLTNASVKNMPKSVVDKAQKLLTAMKRDLDEASKLLKEPTRGLSFTLDDVAITAAESSSSSRALDELASTIRKHV